MGWTRNYYNLLTAFLLGDTTETSSNTPVDYQPPIVMRLMNGTYTNVLWYGNLASVKPEEYNSGRYEELITKLMNIGKAPLNYVTSMDQTASFNGGIMFGTGETAATYEDYILEAPITSGLTLVNGFGTRTAPSAFDAVTHKYSSTRTFTINNTGASSITIKELGIVLGNCLLYREVLATPITIDPGESVTVSFTREATVFNYTPYT